MAEVAPAPAPAKAAKKKAAPRPKKTGPSVAELVVKAVSASKERSGVSLAAVKKALAAGGYDVERQEPGRCSILTYMPWSHHEHWNNNQSVI